MKRFSFRPTLTTKGRTFKGLRGYAGKPFHPPLTDIPIAAFVIVAVLDLLSAIGGDDKQWATEFWHVARWVLLIGLIVAALAAITGVIDRNTSSEAGTQARRTINAHALLMVIAVVVQIVNMIWRSGRYDKELSTPGGIVVLSIVAAVITALGATYGGTLVFDYGFNVETAGDHPVWHKSEVDVMPGDHHDA